MHRLRLCVLVPFSSCKLKKQILSRPIVSEYAEQYQELVIDPVANVYSTLLEVQLGDAVTTDDYPEGRTVLPTLSEAR